MECFPPECHAESGSVIHTPTQRKLAFGQLIAAASGLQPPADPPLKNPLDFTLIGKPTRRTDSLAKVTGSASLAWTRASLECSSRPSNAAQCTAARRAASMRRSEIRSACPHRHRSENPFI